MHNKLTGQFSAFFERAFAFTARLPLCILLLAGCKQQSQQGGAQPPPAAVTVSHPLRHSVTDWDVYSGRLQSPETATVSARVSGLITNAPFKEGALVKKGDVLFVIDERPFKTDLENKQAIVAKDAAQLELARAQLARFQDLLSKRAVSQQDYDVNRANFSQAEAQLAADKAAEEQAALNLEWAHVTAPISGRIGRIMVTEGNLVNGGAGQATELTTIVSVDPIYCYVAVPERAFLKYQAMAAAEQKKDVRSAKIPCAIQLESESEFRHTGSVDFIDNNLDPNTGTIQVRGVFENPDDELTPGLSAKLRLTGSAAYDALLVPDAAIGTNQNEHYVLAVGGDNVVETRKVQLGALFGSLRAITKGLEVTDRVVTNGLQQARPGAKVEPHDAAIPAEDLKALESEDSQQFAENGANKRAKAQ